MSTNENTVILKVAATSDAKALGSSIAHYILEGRDVQVRVLGAGACNQAVKAVAIANGWCAPRVGKILAARPSFTNVEGRDGTMISGIVLELILT